MWCTEARSSQCAPRIPVDVSIAACDAVCVAFGFLATSQCCRFSGGCHALPFFRRLTILALNLLNSNTTQLINHTCSSWGSVYVCYFSMHKLYYFCDKISFVGVTHLTRGDRSCSWALYRCAHCSKARSSHCVCLAFQLIFQRVLQCNRELYV